MDYMNEKKRLILCKEMKRGELTQEQEETLIAIMKDHIKETGEIKETREYNFWEFFERAAELGYRKLTIELLEVMSSEAVIAIRKLRNEANYKHYEWRVVHKAYGSNWSRSCYEFERDYEHALEGAVKGNQIELVKELIEFDKNFTIKYKDDYNKGKHVVFGNLEKFAWQMVKYAVENENLEMVKLLVNVSLMLDPIAIENAMERENEVSAKIIKVIFEHDYPSSSENLLINFSKAIEYGDLNLVKIWLKKIERLRSFRDKYKDYYMKFVIQYGNIEVFELLKEYEIDVNRPLNLADVWNTLLEFETYRHPDKDFDGGYGHLITLAVVYAIFEGRDWIRILEKLIEEGADVTVDNNYCIKRAVDSDCFKITKILIEAGADVTVDNNYCLKMARKNGNEEIANLLIAAGTEIDS